MMVTLTWWTFRIFFFSARGRGRGSPRRREGGGRLLIENPKKGEYFPEKGEDRGAGRVFAGNFGGGGG